ncbi:hypothetical protein BDN71DRAFT_283217 [Pleurotus eryngii]|uniref:Uncharacterized protein n=1 Tax=Pleurotus eryngii TaxID=5323 RepID=A0A9P5ZLW7_PLEER|nr:hypothetical protein BDN71DRAFT_283217 [Pleurotus eryngii]
MVAQNDSELTPLGSYNPYYDRPTYNGLQHAKWYFEVNRPADPEYALEFDYAVEALRSLQRAVSELFVEQHGADVSLRNWLLWPVPYTSAKRFSNALERRSFSPLLAYHADGVAVAPADLDTKLRGSIVEASFTLHHQSLRTYDCDHFHARVKRIVVLKDGQGTPRPLKFNESRDSLPM